MERGARRVVSGSKPIPTRLSRALELALSVEGVAFARVWVVEGRILVAISKGPSGAPRELLDRVERATSALWEPGESWEYGFLAD